MKRNKLGQYTHTPFHGSNWSGLILMLSTMLLGGYLHLSSEVQEPISPLGPVYAVEEPALLPEVVPTAEPTPKPYNEMTIPEKIEYTWGPAEGKIAKRVAFCESSYRPYAAHTESSAKGIFQILKGTWKAYGCMGDPLNADDNIACARIIYDRSGWQPWFASEGCWKGAK